MTTVIEEARAWYETEYPVYEEVWQKVAADVRSLAATNGVGCEVSGRAKSLTSFVKKAHQRRYSDPRGQTTDLAGVRAIVASVPQRDELVRLLEQEFPGAIVEHKEPSLTELGYRGVHLTITVQSLTGVDQPCLCEIQVRTNGEDLWNRISHELLYKPELALPESVVRPLYLLQALAELIDGEVGRALKTIVDHPLHPASRLLAAAEREYYSRCAGESVRELSLEVLQLVAPLITDIDAYDEHLRTFAAENESKLRRILGEHVSDQVNILLSQPECVVLFERLEADSFALFDACRELPEEWLGPVKDAWGYVV